MEHIKKFNELWIQDQFKKLTEKGKDTDEAEEILLEIGGEYLNPLKKSDITFTSDHKTTSDAGMISKSYKSYEFKYGSRICVARHEITYFILSSRHETYSIYLSDYNEDINIPDDKMDIGYLLAKKIFNKVEKIYKK